MFGSISNGVGAMRQWSYCLDFTVTQTLLSNQAICVRLVIMLGLDRHII